VAVAAGEPGAAPSAAAPPAVPRLPAAGWVAVALVSRRP
jgi:hypothetical protein